MFRFLFAICLGLSFLLAQTNLDSLSFSPSKIIYIKNTTPKELLDKTLYIGQKITITYSLLLLDGSELVNVDFDTSPRNGVELLNEDSISWQLQDNGSYQASYIYKILSKKATIPQIRATAITQNQKYKDIAISPKISLDVYNLKNNPKYSGVISSSLKVLHAKTKIFDEENVITILELEADNANLEDLSIPNPQIIKQGFQAISQASEQNIQHGVYYLIFPKNITNLSFEFFSLAKNQFQNISIPIIISHDNVAAQDNLKPKNIFLLYSTLFLIASVLISLALYILIWRHKLVLLVAILLFLILLWHIFYRHTTIIKTGEQIKILPTHNSTTLFIPSQPLEVQIIGSHGDFYKIQTPDDKIGWIKKDHK